MPSGRWHGLKQANSGHLWSSSRRLRTGRQQVVVADLLRPAAGPVSDTDLRIEFVAV